MKYFGGVLGTKIRVFCACFKFWTDSSFAFRDIAGNLAHKTF